LPASISEGLGDQHLYMSSGIIKYESVGYQSFDKRVSHILFVVEIPHSVRME